MLCSYATAFFKGGAEVGLKADRYPEWRSLPIRSRRIALIPLGRGFVLSAFIGGQFCFLKEATQRIMYDA
jgi:hypothetical protein